MNKIIKPKLIFLLIFILLVIPKSAMAFMPPSYLAIIAASIGGWVWFSFIFLSVNFIVLLKFAKKIYKKNILIFFAIIFVLLVTFVLIRGKQARDLNLLSTDLGAQFEIDLSKITKEQIQNYRIFYSPGSIYEIVNIENSEALNYLSLENMVQLFFNQASFNKFAEENKINKDDKLLFLCEFGGRSRALAVLFNNSGYDAYFSKLYTIDNNRSNLIKAEFIKETDNFANFVVIPYEWRDKTKKDIHVTFNLARPEFFELLVGDWSDIEIVSYEKFKIEMAQEKNIVCTVNLNEMLTKYLLNSKGIKEAKLYKLPIKLPNGI